MFNLIALVLMLFLTGLCIIKTYQSLHRPVKAEFKIIGPEMKPQGVSYLEAENKPEPLIYQQYDWAMLLAQQQTTQQHQQQMENQHQAFEQWQQLHQQQCQMSKNSPGSVLGNISGSL